MSPLVKKEIRLLLPAWSIAMLLAFFPIPIWGIGGPREVLDIPIPFLMFILGLLLLGISSFGQEFASANFSVLLSQPLERRRIWLVKSGILAAAFISIWLAELALASWQLYDSYYLNDKWLLFPAQQVVFYHTNVASAFLAASLYTLSFVTMAALAIYCGALWTTLLIRHVVGSFWFALFIPFLLTFGVGFVLDFFNFTDSTISFIIAIVLVAYSAAAFLAARRLFLRAQDTQWTGGVFSFSWTGRTDDEATAALSKPRHWVSACVWKRNPTAPGEFFNCHHRAGAAPDVCHCPQNSPALCKSEPRLHRRNRMDIVAADASLNRLCSHSRRTQTGRSGIPALPASVPATPTGR